MSTGDDDKGFLADDDLFSELDAWDKTFDALHEQDSGGTAAAAAPPPVVAAVGADDVTPAPAPMPTATRPSPSPSLSRTPAPSPSPSLSRTPAPSPSRTPAPSPSPSRTPAPSPVSVRRAGAESPFGDVTPTPPTTDEHDETDFSDIGFDGEPEALGAMLGPPPLPDIEEAAAAALPARRLVVPPVRLPSSPGFDDEDEDSVFTSASRPIVRVPPRPPSAPPAAASRASLGSLQGSPTDEELFGDLPSDVPSGAFPKVTPRSPPPSAPGADKTRVADANLGLFDEGGAAAAGAQRTRIAGPNVDLLAEARGAAERASRGPAIVRRTVQSLRRAPVIDDDDDDDAFAGPEATRVADLAELERIAQQQRDEAAQASAAAAAFFADDEAPAVVLEADEDFYADIEIGGSDEPDEKGTPSALGRRTSAHVVRRTSGSVSGPIPIPPTTASENVLVELEADEHDDGHVRTSRPARVTPAVAPPSEHEAAMSVDEALADVDLAATVPVAEDDFSDVAAAVSSRTIALPPGGPPAAATAAAIPAPSLPVEGEDPFGDLADREDDAATSSLPPVRRSAPPAPATEPAPSGDAAIPAATADTMSGALVAVSQIAGLSLVEQARPLEGAVSAPLEAVPVAAARERSGPELAPELPPPRLLEPSLALDLDVIALPERVDPTAGMDLTEAAAQSLLVYERELEALEDSAAAASFRIEAGRLCERVGDTERARLHYEAALLADPRATPALRGLRRIARSVGEIGEATTHLDAELTLAGPLERRALTLHRVDLLMAAGEQDLARVAVGELLDEAPSDVRALLAQLELAFLDGRADEFGESLGRLAAALGDPALRAALDTARGHLDERPGGDRARAAAAFARATEADPAARGAHLAATRAALGDGDRAAAVAAVLALAAQVASGDAPAAAALGLRGALHARRAGHADVEATALAGAVTLAAADPLVLSAQAEAATRLGDTATAAAAFRALAEAAPDPAERAHAALRAAAGAEPDAAVVLLAHAVAIDGDDEHASAALAARLAAAQPPPDAASDVGAEPGPLATFLAARLLADPARQRDRIRLARLRAAQGAVEEALGLLSEGRTVAPSSSALIEVEAEILASAGHLPGRAALLAEVAAQGGDQVDPEVAHLRAAVAIEAVATTAVHDPARALVSALDAWGKVLDFDPDSGRAHGAAITLARRLGDRDVLIDVLGRAQARARTPVAAVTFALARAHAAASSAGGAPDRGRAEELLREAAEIAPVDPRRATASLWLAGTGGRLGDAALVLEELATALGSERAGVQDAALLRFRAAHLLLDRGDDPVRAVQLLQQVATAVPGFTAAADLLSTARRRTGDTGGSGPVVRAGPDTGGDAFARLVREADLLAQQDPGHAVALYVRALQLRPGDPIAAEPLARAAAAAGDAGPAAELALADLKSADESGDAGARADAYEALARIDGELRGDAASALLGVEAAAEADPTRHAVLRRLERAYAADGRWADLVRVRDRQLAALAAAEVEVDAGDDLAHLSFDRTVVAERDGKDGNDLADAYRAIVARDRRFRLALFHLETQVRRHGSSAELASLAEAIADLFNDDIRSRAAFLTRAGEALTDFGQIDAAIERFRSADGLRPGHIPALRGWRDAALRGQLWVDLAEAATREAGVTDDPIARGALHHLAGVAYMDKALASDRAAASLRRALAADPSHKDAFLRLRILLAEHGDYEDLATVLAGRLTVEDSPAARVELHRALADLHRNFLGDRDTAKQHYRAILADAPADRSALTALADICWEQGAWPECAEALMARSRLERDPEVQKGIYARLGAIYADRLPDPPHAIKAFQRVLALDPNDHFALERLADLGMATGEWKMALGACERLVKNEPDPDKRVGYLHRVGRIFQTGFGDRKRAERAYTMALDLAPTQPAALHELIRFYLEAHDVTSVRIHTGRVAAAMRARLQEAPLDSVAYRAVARAMAARASAGVPGSLEVARCAAEMAIFTRAISGDDAGEIPEDGLLHAETPPVDVALLARPEADDLLFPRAVPAEIRHVFALLGDRIAKHVGVDLRPYGVTRGDRLRAREHPVAVIAQEIAERLGLGEIDVYLSQRQPLAMVAEPTSPVSLVVGAQLADDPVAVRFAAASALKLAQAQLAIPGRLPVDDLGVLVVALLRLFMPDFAYLAVDGDATAVQNQKLRRLIPTSLMNELRPYALAIDPASFDHRALARGIAAGGLRAGVLVAGSIATPLRVLMARQQVPDIAAAMNDAVLRELVLFAIGDEHAALLAP